MTTMLAMRTWIEGTLLIMQLFLLMKIRRFLQPNDYIIYIYCTLLLENDESLIS